MISVAKKDKAEGSLLKSDRKRCSEINEILKNLQIKDKAESIATEAQAWKGSPVTELVPFHEVLISQKSEM